MPYDAEFFRMYQDYLQEPIVRQNHNHMFSLFGNLILPEAPMVVDLGCGICEYKTFDKEHIKYAGVDLIDTDRAECFIKADYTKFDFIRKLPFAPNAFISLFSIEPVCPANVRYSLYEKVFIQLPSVCYGLIGGFFYESRRNQEMVSETNDVKSYQTIEDPSRYISRIFTELRVHIRTPSRMFGQDVIEVWKFLVRRDITLP